LNDFVNFSRNKKRLMNLKFAKKKFKFSQTNDKKLKSRQLLCEILELNLNLYSKQI
jgi:hypothetical protein